MTRKRCIIATAGAAAALVAALALAPAAFAAAGGGSAGFGGGHGGGGGGKGAALYILFQILIRVALLGHGLGALIILGVIVAWVIFNKLSPSVRNFATAQETRGRAHSRRARNRERRVELAAAEAAEDDPAFAPDRVRPAAAKLFTDIQAAWDARDQAKLARLVAPQLRAEWERRLGDFDRRGWHNRVRPIGEPQVEYVGLRNRGDHRRDQVVVRIDARLSDYVVDAHGNHINRRGRATETIRIREFWTLAKKPGSQQWILASIEQGAEGAHALSDEVIPTPWADEQALRDESLLEQANADRLPDHVKPAEVADLQFSGDARAAALDLSLADGRFAPDVLEIAARRAVAAWADAVDGGGPALAGLATAQAIDQLLHPSDPGHATRLVVRGPVIRQIRIADLDAAATPPTMAVEVDLEGCRYVEDRSTTTVLAGHPSRRARFTERWTLALGSDPAQPWRIVRVETPALRA